MENTVNQYIYGEKDSYSNYSIVQSPEAREASVAAQMNNPAVIAALTQQMGAESSPIVSTRPMPLASSKVYKIVREITLNSVVPKGSRMVSKQITFAKGQKVVGLDKCTGADAGYIEVVQNGSTFNFPCGRNSALREVQEAITAEDIVEGTGQGRSADTIEGDCQSFLCKNKMLLVGVGVVAAIGAGYYFMKKK